MCRARRSAVLELLGERNHQHGERGEQGGGEGARHTGYADQAVGNAIDGGVEAEHRTNRVREANAGIADKHKIECRREQ